MGISFNPLIFSGLVNIPAAGAVTWRGSVPTEANLPSTGNSLGDAIAVQDMGKIYVWSGSPAKWHDTGITTAAFGNAPNADGASIVVDNSNPLVRKDTLVLQPADATNPGAVSTSAQTFAGDKTFNDDVTVEGLIDAKGGIDSTTNTLTIGANADNINIGGPGAIITISGDTTYEHVTNLYVKDKTITLNDGGALDSGFNSGIEVQEDGSITGYAQVSSDRNAWELKAPNQAGVAVIDPGALGITIDQSSHDPVSIGDVGNSPNLQGGTITGQVLNLQPADATNPLAPFPGVVSTAPQSFAGDKTFNDIVIVSGNLEARGGVDHPFSPLQIGFNSLTVEIGAATEFNGNQITEVSSLTLEPTTTDGVYATLYTNNAPDFASVAFAGTNPGSGEISYTDGGNLTISSSTSLNITSPDVNIGDAVGTTDIVGTVTIEYNPADPTDWAPAPTHVIEAIDQLAERFVDQDTVTKEPTGFPNRTDSVISFSDSTPDRTFTIAPNAPATSFVFYVKGKKFTKSTSESIQIPNLAGDHYIYYNDTGALATTQVSSSSLFENNALVAVVYWNTDTSTSTYFAEERHGLTMDGTTHSYLHTVFGTRYLSGLALENFDVDGTGDLPSNAQFTSDQGSVRDEDILIQIATQTQIPILYRQGQLWRKKAADTYPVIYQGTAGYGAGLRLPYNQFTGGNWQLTEVTNNKFVLVHFFATNDINHGVVGIQGINQYNDVTAARVAAATEITSLSGLPFVEFAPIGTVVFETADGYANEPKAKVRSVNGGDYVDFRGTQLYTPAGNATTHSLLSGLGNDDHFQYLLEDGTRAMSGALNMGTHQINNVVDPTSAQDAATKNYVDAEVLALENEDLTFLKLDGSRPMTGSLDMDGSSIDNAASVFATGPLTGSNLIVGDLGVQIDGINITTLGVVVPGSLKIESVLELGGDLDLLNGAKVINMAEPTSSQDGATKNYVDGKIDDSIVDGVTTIAPSQNAVFDALALKQDVGNYITDLTGEVTASGPGSAAATIAANAVTNSKLAQMPASTLKGNNTGSPADPTDLTASDVRTLLSVLPDYSGDISRTTFTALDNTIVPQPVTNLLFSNASVRGFDIILSVERNATYAEYSLKGIQKASSWEMSQEYVGDDVGIVFSITAAGQVQYTTTNTGVDADLKFRAITV